jgi:MFS family permease
MPSSTFQSMAVLSLIGLVDSISYMAVAPSLIFYVLQVGGDKDMYGLIMSVFSFASFCGKPLYGIWVDRSGNKFRTPYIFSFMLAIFGAILYFLGNAHGANSPQTALAFIFCGRLFSGLGGANQALGYAYIASVIPQAEQTKTNTILSMMRILGMATGPAFNLLLSEIRTDINMGGYVLKVDSLNSVGLLLAVGNALVLTCVILFLEEPPPKEDKKIPEILSAGIGAPPETTRSSLRQAIFSVEIILPILILLVANSSFQLYVMTVGNISVPLLCLFLGALILSFSSSIAIIHPYIHPYIHTTIGSKLPSPPRLSMASIGDPSKHRPCWGPCRWQFSFA